MAVVLEEAQVKAKSKMKNGSVLIGDVGTGKSIVGIHYYFEEVCGGRVSPVEKFTRPKDLVIITTVKKRDGVEWQKDLAKFALSTDPNASYGGRSITIDSWNNIHKYTDVKDAFFIFDEQRVVGSGLWAKSFIKIAKNNQWILLSATPGDTWMDYIPIFVAHGFYKNRTDFIRSHVVYNNFSRYPKVDRYVDTHRLRRHKSEILVPMPTRRHTTRHIEYIPVTHDRAAFDSVVKDRWHVFEDRPIKDVGELFNVMRKVVNSDDSRFREIVSLHKKHPRLIVFYNFNYELDYLRRLGEWLDIPMAEWNGHKHEEIPEGEKWIYLVQYTAGSEGWNCVSTNAMVFNSLNYSYKKHHQAMGRIDRMNTEYKDLYYYIFMSDSLIDKAISKTLNKKKDFNEKEMVTNFVQKGSGNYGSEQAAVDHAV